MYTNKKQEGTLVWGAEGGEGRGLCVPRWATRIEIYAMALVSNFTVIDIIIENIFLLIFHL